MGARPARRKRLSPSAARVLHPARMQILFITATRIGDAVLSTGLLDHLLRTYPEARITIACGPVAEGVFVRMPRRVRIIVVDKRRFDLHWLVLWRATVTQAWDLVIDLRGSALSYALLARQRQVLRGRHAGHKTAQLASVLGLATPPLPVGWIDAADTARATTLLPGGPWIGLGPTANWAGKVWPAERFVTLFRALRDGPVPGARAAVFAGPGETERTMAAPVLDALRDAVDLRGTLSLPEASACLARCAMFVGNDSGLMHLSAAIGTPTLGLFGPSPSGEYAPAGPRTAFVVAPGPDGKAPIAGVTDAAALEAAVRLLRS